MILRFNLYSIAITTLIRQNDAFTPSITSSSRISLNSLNSDWDNKDFLSALSGGSDDLQKANENYQALSGANQAKNEWLAKSMQPPTGGDGGNRGASPDLLEKMGYTQNQQRPPPPPQQFVPQQAPPPQQPQFYDQNGNPITTMPMIYDANGNPVSFAQPAAVVSPQQAPPQPGQTQANPAILPPQFAPVAEPPLPPKTKSSSNDHRPVGYNADAYTVSNTADVYFAQLKQDSKVRKQAWLSGDIDRANQVFTDESVKKIGDSWVDNPYTKEQNVKDARAQIEGAVRMQVLGGQDDKGVSQISYKKKLEEKMAKKRGVGGNGNVPVPTAPTAVAPTPKVNDAPADLIRPPQANLGNLPNVGGPSPQVRPGELSPTSTNPVPNTPPQTTAPPRAASTGEDSEEETRRKVRTLQGLLLKQRGGPGFGAGRLRAPEAQRLESTLKEVTDILRSEVSGGVTSGMPAPPPVTKSNPVPKASVPVQPSPQALVAQTPPKPQPPQPQPSQTTQSTSSSSDPIAGTVACVEAALKMYKEASTASERDALLLPLREAFMAAAGASNKIIAQREMDAFKSANSGVTSPPPPPPAAKQSPPPMMEFPTSYNVAKAEPEDTKDEYAAVQVEDNTSKLKDAYNALKDFSGDGKFGLKNISGNEVRWIALEITEPLIARI